MKAIYAILVAALLAAPGSRAIADDPATRPAEGILQQLNGDQQRLYRKCFGAIVRVHIEQNPLAVLSTKQREDYEVWRKSLVPPGGGPAGGGGDRRDGGPVGRRGGRGDGGPGAPLGAPGGFGPPFGGPGGPGRGGFGSVVQFIQSQLTNLEKSTRPEDKTAADNLRSLLNRLQLNRNGFSGDLYGLVLDDQGNTIVPTSMLREVHKDPLTVTAPDGTEVKARFIGSNLVGAYSILKMEELSGAHPCGWTAQPPLPGQMLMGICGLAVGGGGGQGNPQALALGAVSWHNVAQRVGQTTPPERFNLERTDERTGTFLFDLNGQLAAMAWGPAASTSSRLKDDIKFIIDNGRDIEPRQLGVNYMPVPATENQTETMKNSLKTLGSRSYAFVKDIVKGSLAEKLGIQKDDFIINVNGQPIGRVLEVMAEMATRNGAITVKIVRNGDEKTLQLKLDQ